HEGQKGLAPGRAAAAVQWWWGRACFHASPVGASHPTTGVGVMKKMRRVGEVSLSAIEDQWQRDATAAAITAARGVVQVDGPIPPLTPIGRLSDTEWGWIFCGALFAWISKRAEQATAEQIDTEQLLRLTALDPEPWDAGAVAQILPELADACSDLDWSKPLAQW